MFLNRRRNNPSSPSLVFVYTGDGVNTFDPSITTGKLTTIIWQTSDGQRAVTTGTTHNFSYTPASGGPYRCTARVIGGLGLVSQIDANTDSLCGNLLDFRRATQMLTLSLYSDPLLTGDLSSLAAMTQMWYLSLSFDPLLTGDLSSLAAMTQMRYLYLSSDPLLTGDLSSLAAMTQMQTLSLSSDPLLTGDLSSLAAMTQMQTLHLFSDPLLTCTTIAPFVSIRDMRIYSMGWLVAAAGIDIVIDSLYAARMNYTYASGIALRYGGTDAIPSGTEGTVPPADGVSDSDWTWDSVHSVHIPQTPQAKMYICQNDPYAEGFKTWVFTKV